MTSPIRLGGFKVLKDIVRIPITCTPSEQSSFSRPLQRLAIEKINLPYLTLIRGNTSWNMEMIVNATDAARALSLMIENPHQGVGESQNRVIVSVFPHRNNPRVTGSLFQLLGEKGYSCDSLAHSPSAVSMVVKEDLLNPISDALFGTFRFGAYRTPADWKLAQKGKEALYKEVVASYQEQRPKVYALEVRHHTDLIRIRLRSRDWVVMGDLLKASAETGSTLPFLISNRCPGREDAFVLIALPSPWPSSLLKFKAILPDSWEEGPLAVSVFSMNGPHFGDRYGIASELLGAFESRDVELLGLSCTIASICGLVPATKTEQAVETIKACFEVPSVVRKGVP